MQEMVRDGYNNGDYASTYRNRLTLNDFEKMFFTKLTETLKGGSEILDIGSGPGVPYDHHLAQAGFKVTGIDISEKHIAMACKNVPSAKYILGNFLNYSFLEKRFDAIVCLYTLFHIHRDKHAEIISKISSMLKPQGHLLITVGTEDVAHKKRDNFCGSNMAWSYFDAQTNMDIITQCGFTIIQSLNEKDYGSDEKHVWAIAKKI